MNPPGVFDADGHPYQRRDHDDLSPALLIGYETWVRRFFVHRGRIIVLVGALSSLATYFLGLVGKTHAVEELAMRVSRLEHANVALAAEVQSLKQSARIQNYVVCSLSARLDPSGTPPECRLITATGLRP